MNFISFEFIIFLAVLFLLFVAMPPRFRLPLLLVGSYLFYATWNIPFIGVIFLTTTIDYWISRFIHNHPDARNKKLFLITGLVINLVILGFFKYCNFFLNTSYSLAHWMGYPLNWPTVLDIILPLGVSFYTFEAISYMVDVYRGKSPAKSWWDYNFYIMYFPHLISGPIVRFEELWQQYRNPLELPGLERLAKGCELIMLGFLFKVLIANSAALIADPLFNHPEGATSLATLLGVLGFTVQIYFDFMGYTHIARGVSLLFNIELPLNFNHPYLANNISNFWERWHISLSRWIRDYLFIPLGGSRGSQFKTMANLIITMLIAGAWHGAGWTFIAWGGYHGVLLAFYHLYKSLRTQWFQTPDYLSNGLYHLLSVMLTFVFAAGGWVLFRAHNFTDATVIYQNLLNLSAYTSELSGHLLSKQIPALLQIALLLLCCFLGPWVVSVLEKLYRPLPYAVKVQLACALLLICIIFTAEGSQPFIYFQF